MQARSCTMTLGRSRRGSAAPAGRAAPPDGTMKALVVIEALLEYLRGVYAARITNVDELVEAEG